MPDYKNHYALWNLYLITSMHIHWRTSTPPDWVDTHRCVISVWRRALPINPPANLVGLPSKYGCNLTTSPQPGLGHQDCCSRFLLALCAPSLSDQIMPHTTPQNPFLSQIHPLPVTRMGAIPPHSLPGFGCLGHNGPSPFLPSTFLPPLQFANYFLQLLFFPIHSLSSCFRALLSVNLSDRSM